MENDFESQVSAQRKGANPGCPAGFARMDLFGGQPNIITVRDENPTPPKEGGMGHPLM